MRLVLMISLVIVLLSTLVPVSHAQSIVGTQRDYEISRSVKVTDILEKSTQSYSVATEISYEITGALDPDTNRYRVVRYLTAEQIVYISWLYEGSFEAYSEDISITAVDNFVLDLDQDDIVDYKRPEIVYPNYSPSLPSYNLDWYVKSSTIFISDLKEDLGSSYDHLPSDIVTLETDARELSWKIDGEMSDQFDFLPSYVDDNAKIRIEGELEVVYEEHMLRKYAEAWKVSYDGVTLVDYSYQMEGDDGLFIIPGFEFYMTTIALISLIIINRRVFV